MSNVTSWARWPTGVECDKLGAVAYRCRMLQVGRGGLPVSNVTSWARWPTGVECYKLGAVAYRLECYKLGAVAYRCRMSDSQSNEPGFKSHCVRLESLASLIIPRCHS